MRPYCVSQVGLKLLILLPLLPKCWAYLFGLSPVVTFPSSRKACTLGAGSMHVLLFVSDTISTYPESGTPEQINKAIISEMVFIDRHGVVSCLHGFLMYI